LKRVTGTHVYTYAKCAHAVALDLHQPRSERRPATEAEAFSLARGIAHEAQFVAGLRWPAPQYDDHDHVAGAALTQRWMREGVAGIHQGVLLAEGRLGIPDLLRREPGASALGDHHYVVGDVKSSGRARGDQILQIAFYSRLLGELQGRAPSYAYLVLKDGREERFALDEFAEAIVEVETNIARIAADPDAEPSSARPYWSPHCRSCHWSVRCSTALHESDDLSLLPNMTRGLREALEAAGVTRASAAAELPIDRLAEQGHLEAPMLRRLQRAGLARREGRALPEPRPSAAVVGDAAIVHFLHDPFAERVLWMGLLYPAAPSGAVHQAMPATQANEIEQFVSLIRSVPGSVPLLHYGEYVPTWFDRASEHRQGSSVLARRFVDLGKRLRSSASFPGPVFGLADLIRFGLGLDPTRRGDGAAVAAWAANGRFEQITAKGESDLRDLATLKVRLLDRTADGSHA
jgi:predicted RecB family nuclease